MSAFKNVTIITGAVTEPHTLEASVKIISEICNPQDICEIIIGYPPARVTPACREELYKIAENDYGFPIVIFEENMPRMKNITDVFRMARGSHIIICPSDMAFDLKAIPVMIEKAKADPYTVVSASRNLKGCRYYGYGKIKEILNKTAQAYLRILYNVKLTDMTMPYQIVPAQAYRQLNIEGEGFQIFIEVTLKLMRLGYKFTEIPTDCYARNEGISANNIKETASYFGISLKNRFMKKEDIVRR